MTSRRCFLGGIGRAAAAVAFSGMATGALAGCAAGIPRVAGRFDGGSVRIPLSDLEGATGFVVDHPDDPIPIYVHRVDEDRFTAVHLRCTHQGCEVDPVPGRLECPCHGSRFAPDGALLGGPADRPLVRYAVEVDGAALRIRTVADEAAPGEVG